jgi:hypothetical protein
MSGQPSNVDLRFLTSFSNLFTIEEQIARRSGPIGEDDDLDLKLVPGIFERLTLFTNELLRDLEMVRENTPSIFYAFGDNILLAQGMADYDGLPVEGSKYKDVVHALEELQGRYMPLAHIYVVPDPLEGRYPELQEFYGTENREASHFLLQTRKNVSVEDFIESLLYSSPDRRAIITGVPGVPDDIKNLLLQFDEE